MEYKELGGAIMVNHHLLFPFDRLEDFLTTTFLESSWGSMGEIALRITSVVQCHWVPHTIRKEPDGEEGIPAADTAAWELEV